MLGEGAGGVEQGPLAPETGAVAVARLGDVFQLGAHRLICGDATKPETMERLMENDPPARLVLTDEPYNVRISGNVTGGDAPRVRDGVGRDERRGIPRL